MCETNEINLADKIENEVIQSGLAKNYKEVLQIAQFTARMMLNNVPMTNGLYSAKRKEFDRVYKIITKRLKKLST